MSREVTRRFLSDQVGSDDLSRRAYDEFLACRSILMMRLEWMMWGMLGTNLVYVEDRSIATLGTDGVHFYCNPSFFLNKLTDDERLTGVCHEIHHAVSAIVPLVIEGRVINRRDDRDPKLWNFAADHIDNLDLYEAGLTKFTSIEVLADPKYAGWTTEEVYDDLEKNQPSEKDQQKQFDSHFEIGVDPGEMGAGPGDQQPDDKGAPRPAQGAPGQDGGDSEVITPEVFADIVQGWETTLARSAAAVQEEALRQGVQGGFIPAGLLRYVKSLIEPRYHWTDKLAAYTESVLASGFSIEEPNKAFFNQGITIEGYRAYRPSLLVDIWIDASKSVDEAALQAFLSEIKGMLEQHERFKARLGTFDAAVHEDSIREIDDSTIDEFDDFVANVRGGGGTLFGSVYNWLIARDEVPHLLIIWTDGYPADSTWGRADYCPTIFVVKGSFEKAPHGETIYYDGPSDAKRA